MPPLVIRFRISSWTFSSSETFLAGNDVDLKVGRSVSSE